MGNYWGRLLSFSRNGKRKIFAELNLWSGRHFALIPDRPWFRLLARLYKDKLYKDKKYNDKKERFDPANCNL